MQQEDLLNNCATTTKLTSEKQSISLDSAGVRAALADRIKKDIDDHTEEIYYEGFRTHLGASVIGDECKRRLWYMFRWCATTRPDGRMQRLFNRGNLEENRHFEWLRGIGFTLWTHDESTGKQLRIANKCGGHFGGSLDGIVQFPAKYNIKEYALLSCKTSGTGAGFNKVQQNALVLAKPEHYTQECVYGYSYGIEYVLYICANKNDDDLAIKVEKLDFKHAQDMEAKAHSIIFAQDAPQRISENPTYFKCKSLCEFKDICHFGKAPTKNCRSCVYCYPVDNKEFYCKKWDGNIPGEEIPKGCPEWIAITGPQVVGSHDKREQSEYEVENVPLP